MPRPPVSCEPCRKRKIRCSQTQAPCDACVRRGIPRRCHYEKSSLSPDSPELGQHPALPSTSELLDRINSLETIVRNNIEHESPSTSYDSMSRTPADSQSPLAPARSIENTPGTLATDATGHERYEVRSSQWNASFDPAPFPEGFSGGLGEGGMSYGLFGEAQSLPKSHLLRALPPMSHLQKMKDVYFQVFSPLFHILHDPTFDRQFESFQQDVEQVKLSWLALLYVIIAIAATALNDDDTILADMSLAQDRARYRSVLSSKYRAAAMQCLVADNFIAQHSFETLQALVLLVYALNHSHQASWPLLGLTQNIALAIGAHIDPANLRVTHLRAEERRRCWAGLMMLHTIQNTTLGIMDAHKIHNEVQLPADINDLDLMNPNYNPRAMQGQQTPTQMTYIRFKFRLYEIMGSICRKVIRNSRLASSTVVDELDKQIKAEQDAWCRTFRMTPDLPLYHLIHLQILHMYANQLILLLHRPLLVARAPMAGVHVDRSKSRARCVYASLQNLSIHETFHESEAFQMYQWYHRGLGSFHAFHAAVFLGSVLLTRPSAASINHRCLPQKVDVSDVTAALRSCQLRFESLRSGSDICGRALPVLEWIMHKVNAQQSAARSGRQVNNATSRARVTGSSSTGPRSVSMMTDEGFELTGTQGWQPPSPPFTHRFSDASGSMQQLNTSQRPFGNGQDSLNAWENEPCLPDELLAQLQPDHWLSPTRAPWSGWEMDALNV